MFEVTIKKSALKAFGKIPKAFANQITKALLHLRISRNPETEGIQLAAISPKTFRIRVGNYRVIYRVNFELRLIDVLAIGHRKDIYR